MRVALIGSPVAASPSPALQRAAAEACGITFEYGIEEVGREDLASALPRLLAELDGLNVTRPLKEAVIPYLDHLAPEAARARSVNTVVVRGGGTVGHSTDGAGFLDALPGMPRHALLLGTGGAARAVAAALLGRGARVRVSGRNAAAGRRLARDLGIGFVLPGALAEELARADLLVNTTPVSEDDPLPAGLPLHEGLTVYDLVYRPRITPLLRRAREAGCRTVEGLEMLVAQAVRSFELWTGVRPSAESMRRAGVRELAGAPTGGPR